MCRIFRDRGYAVEFRRETKTRVRPDVSDLLAKCKESMRRVVVLAIGAKETEGVKKRLVALWDQHELAVGVNVLREYASVLKSCDIRHVILVLSRNLTPMAHKSCQPDTQEPGLCDIEWELRSAASMLYVVVDSFTAPKSHRVLCEAEIRSARTRTTRLETSSPSSWLRARIRIRSLSTTDFAEGKLDSSLILILFCAAKSWNPCCGRPTDCNRNFAFACDMEDSAMRDAH